MTTVSYQIKLDQFEGPFDLLLFFIERDELDIYNIPITNIIKDFLQYIKEQEQLSVELGSEFILFISTLMRIKAKMLLPRKELDEAGNEIDPRQELVDKILEYKRFKEASLKMAEMEATRMLMIKRGNIEQEMKLVGEAAGEGTEIHSVTLFKLMKTFDKVMRKMNERLNKPQHVVFRYNYTMEDSRTYLLEKLKAERTMSFEQTFDVCEDRIHAIFIFLSILELVQLRFMNLLAGTGRNNFLLEYNNDAPEESALLVLEDQDQKVNPELN